MAACRVSCSAVQLPCLPVSCYASSCTHMPCHPPALACLCRAGASCFCGWKSGQPPGASARRWGERKREGEHAVSERERERMFPGASKPGSIPLVCQGSASHTRLFCPTSDSGLHVCMPARRGDGLSGTWRTVAVDGRCTVASKTESGASLSDRDSGGFYVCCC